MITSAKPAARDLHATKSEHCESLAIENAKSAKAVDNEGRFGWGGQGEVGKVDGVTGMTVMS